MAPQTQVRPPLTDTVQQFASTPAAALVSKKIQAFTADGTILADTDMAACDATPVAITVTLPSVGAYIGKPYLVKETSGANHVTVDAAGSGTIDGSASIVVPALQAVELIATAVTVAGVVTWQKVTSSSATGSDSTAIHVDIANEINAITDKPIPLIDDVLVLESDADAGEKRSATIGAALAAPEQVTNLMPATPLAADKLAFEDASDSLAMRQTTIGALPIAQAQVRGILLRPAADAAVTIFGTTAAVEITVTAAGTVIIATDPSCYRGQQVALRAVSVAGGGSYTLVVSGGTLTINATGEAPRIIRSETDTWVVMGLEGATIV